LAALEIYLTNDHVSKQSETIQPGYPEIQDLHWPSSSGRARSSTACAKTFVHVAQLTPPSLLGLLVATALESFLIAGRQMIRP
jgi:hypothetical protein